MATVGAATGAVGGHLRRGLGRAVVVVVVVVGVTGVGDLFWVLGYFVHLNVTRWPP